MRVAARQTAGTHTLVMIKECSGNVVHNMFPLTSPPFLPSPGAPFKGTQTTADERCAAAAAADAQHYTAATVTCCAAKLLAQSLMCENEECHRCRRF